MGGDIVSQLRTIATEKKPPSTVIKNFQIFVNKQRPAIAKEIDTVLGNTHPATNLEQLLKCRLIDQFRVSSEVISLLQSCESLKVNQALKCKWFFTELEDPEGFVRDVIPSLSLSTRHKVINKYASLLQNTKSGEILYLGIKSRYGMRAASALLPACGENFIRNELPNIKFSLDPNMVTALLGKYPSLTTEYLKYLADDKSLKTKRQNLSSYERVLLKLSNQDFKSFLNLYENHQENIPYLKLGRRATKKLIKEESDKVLNNYKKYDRILVDKIFFHRLSLDQLKQIYLKSVLPREVTDFLTSSMRTERLFLTNIKPSLRSPFLISAFSSKYGRNFTDEDILFKLKDYWVDYMPEDAKITWLEKKVQEEESANRQASYIAKLPVSNSIPRLKKLIESQSDSNVRREIAEYMIDSIRINHSASSIKSTFEYFNRRFRNEIRGFAYAILYKMTTLGPLYLQLEADDWAPILEFFNILRLRDELQNRIDYVLELLSHRLHNTFLKQGNAESVLEEAQELLGEKPNSLLRLCRGTPFRAKTLSMIINRFEAPKWKNLRQTLTFCEELLEVLCEHSRENENPNEQVGIPKWIFSCIDHNLKAKPDEENSNLLRDCIAHLNKLPDRNLWVSYVQKFILSHHNVCYCDCHDLLKLMQETPDFFLRKIDDILKTKLSCMNFANMSPFYEKCRLYDAYGISSKITKTFLSMMIVPDKRPYAVRVLSILLPPSEYVNLVSQYAPTVTKIESFTEEIKELYDTQQEICKSLVDVSNPSITLPLVKKFAVGDYLKLTVGSFVSICIKVPENEILKVLNELMDCPVSLRKHLLRMTILIAPTEQKIRTIVGVFQKEKNVSVRLVLFGQLQKAFFDEPDDESFNTLSSIISQLTEEDQEALELVFNISKLDESYVTQYLELIWHLVGSAWQNKLPDGKSKIVDLVDRRLLREMKEDFCDTLLKYELSKTLPNSSPGEFVSMYLVHSPTHEVQATRLQNVMEALNPLISSSWNDHILTQACSTPLPTGYVFPVRCIVSDLISNVCSEIESVDHLNPTQLLNELKKWIMSIKPEHSLVQRLKLDLAIASQQSGDTGKVSAVVNLYKHYAETYGPHYPTEVVNILVRNSPSELDQKLATELITLHEVNPLCQIVGINLLSTEVSTEAEVPLYKTLIDTLLASGDSNVQAAAHKFFTNLTTSLF